MYFVFYFVLILKTGLHRGDCRPFIVDGEQVGVIRPDVLKQLFKYPEVFCIRDNDNSKVVELNPAFRDYNEKSENVDRVLRQFRNDGVFVTLKGWRDEVCLHEYKKHKKNAHTFHSLNTQRHGNISHK